MRIEGKLDKNYIARNTQYRKLSEDIECSVELSQAEDSCSSELLTI